MVINLEKLGSYWQIGTVMLSLIISLTYFIIENKQAHQTIQNLSETNQVLTEKVLKLEGHTEGVSHAIELFMENPPGLIKYRVDLLEKRVFGSDFTIKPAPPSTDTLSTEIIPPKITGQ